MKLDFSTGESAQEWPSAFRAEEILERLSGFPRYPQTPKGREIFIEALMKCDSANQATGVVALFDERFPTLRELRAAIDSAKQKNVNQANMETEWRAQGYEYDPTWFERTLREVLAGKAERDKQNRERLLKLSDDLAKNREQRRESIAELIDERGSD